MFTLKISEAGIELVKYGRISNPMEAIRKRMDAIYWTSQGLSRQETADLSVVRRNSVKRYVKRCHAGGLDTLRRFNYKGFNSVLMGHRVSLETFSRRSRPGAPRRP